MPSATRFGVPNRLPSTGIVVPFGILEQQGRAARAQGAVADFGHFETRVDFDRNAFQFAARFELRDEIAQIVVSHRQSSPPGIRPRL